MKAGTTVCFVGHGDMLIGGSVQINRLQGSRVSKRDITNVMNYFSNTRFPMKYMNANITDKKKNISNFLMIW